MQYARNDLELIFDCDMDTHCSVVGNGADFQIVQYPIPDLNAVVTMMETRGFEHAGSIAMRDGEMVLSPLPGGENILLRAAVAYLEGRTKPSNAVAGDSLAWLESLHALADTRAEVAHA